MSTISGIPFSQPLAPQRAAKPCDHSQHPATSGERFTTSVRAVAASKPVFLAGVSTLIPNAASLAKTSEQFGLRVSAELTRMPCNKCGGTGLCQNDFPRAGSGKEANGSQEPLCEGSGKCYYCDGTGEL